jgi:hypothetical protein
MSVSISYWLKKWLKVRLRPDAFLMHAVAMSKDSWARLRVAALIYCMVKAVVFGVGTILVMSLPLLMFQAFFWIPACQQLRDIGPALMVHRTVDDDALCENAHHPRPAPHLER